MHKFLGKLFGWHLWEYRNPFDRKCSICGRREQEHKITLGPNVWEVVNDGDKSFRCNRG